MSLARFSIKFLQLKEHLYHTLAISPGVVFPNACEIFLWQFGEANVWINFHGEKIVKAINFGWHLDKMAH